MLNNLFLGFRANACQTGPFISKGFGLRCAPSVRYPVYFFNDLVLFRNFKKYWKPRPKSPEYGDYIWYICTGVQEFPKHQINIACSNLLVATSNLEFSKLCNPTSCVVREEMYVWFISLLCRELFRDGPIKNTNWIGECSFHK